MTTDPDILREAAAELRDDPEAPTYAPALADWLELFAATAYDPHADIQVTSRSHEVALTLARQILGRRCTCAPASLAPHTGDCVVVQALPRPIRCACGDDGGIPHPHPDWANPMVRINSQVLAYDGRSVNILPADFIATMRDRDPAELETLRGEAWRTGGAR